MNRQDKIHVLSRAVIFHDSKVLLCKTIDPNISIYFLPGGHIEHGESAEACCIRELKEETNANCKIKRFLGCLEYSFVPLHHNICHSHEYNIIFEVESEFLKSSEKIICPENHIELVWMPIHKLCEIDFRPEPLQTLLLSWLIESSNVRFVSKMK